MSSRARQLCYPRSNFSVISSPHQGGLGGSLDHNFLSEFCLIKNTVRLAFALALYIRFLTGLSQPLGPVDIFSTGCHPSQTVHIMVSFFRSEQRKFWRVVLHRRLNSIRKLNHNNSYLRYATELTSQHHATVKFHGVFASHWTSLAFAPGKRFQRILIRDSEDLVTSLMQVVIQTTRYYATLREL